MKRYSFRNLCHLKRVGQPVAEEVRLMPWKELRLPLQAPERGAVLRIRVEPAAGKALRFSRVFLERSIHLEIESLKHLNYELMIMSPRLKVVEYRGYELVQTIFQALDKDGGHLLLPEDYRAMHSRVTSNADSRRLLCDFVAGMTDRYAVEFYSRLKESGASIFKPI